MAKKATESTTAEAVETKQVEMAEDGAPDAGQKDAADNDVERPDSATEATPKAAETNKSGFYIYIGPNIKGLIQTGTIYRGDRENAYKAAAAAIEKRPKVKSLIVSGDALPEARLKVKTPGNILYANYMKLAGK